MRYRHVILEGKPTWNTIRNPEFDQNWIFTPNALPDSQADFLEETLAVHEGPSPFNRSPIRQRGEELAGEIAVSSMDLHPIKSCILNSAGCLSKI